MSEPLTRSIHIRRRRLPHWTSEEGTYFLTFRLLDAMSPELARRISVRRQPHRLADRILDRGRGRCFLADSRIASLVDSALRYFDGERYSLHAYTLMPNHVHVAFRTLQNTQLENVTKVWKGYTSREANKMLGRRGTFWQSESYDSLLHDQHELDRVIDYIVRNPVRAGLTNWRWTAVLRTKFALTDTQG